MRTTAIVSDVHCDGPDSPTQVAFLRFLASTRFDTLVLAGDVFHAFWAPNGEAFAAYQPVVDALLDHPLVVLPGNHDWGLPGFLAARGSAVVADASAAIGARLVMPLGELAAELSHGDEVDTSRRYRAFHAVLRSAAFGHLLDGLGPRGAWALLHRLAGPLGEGTPNPRLVAAQRALATERIAQGAELVVTGHTHAPGCERIGRGTWVNPGDWVTHRTFGVVTGGRVELRRFD